MKAGSWTRHGFLDSVARWAAAVSCAFIFIGSVSAQEVNPATSRSPEQIINELIKLMENKQVIDRRYLDQRDRLTRELSELGDKAIPAIKSAVTGARVNVQSALLMSLAEIKTPLVTDTLLEFALQSSDKNLSEDATARLGFRTMHRPLSQDELSKLDSRLKASVPQSLAIAEFLSRCGHNDMVQRAEAIVARFIAQLNQPQIRVDNSYLSTEAWWCNQYILCLRNLDQARVRKLLRDELAKAKDKRVAIWLTIASGILGEETLMEDFRRIVESEPDVFYCGRMTGLPAVLTATVS